MSNDTLAWGLALMIPSAEATSSSASCRASIGHVANCLQKWNHEWRLGVRLRLRLRVSCGLEYIRGASWNDIQVEMDWHVHRYTVRYAVPVPLKKTHISTSAESWKGGYGLDE
jgi:hypothetical protein